jgi:uncharacterized protein YaiL (DUF2058 family)
MARSALYLGISSGDTNGSFLFILGQRCSNAKTAGGNGTPVSKEDVLPIRLGARGSRTLHEQVCAPQASPTATASTSPRAASPAAGEAAEEAAKERQDRRQEAAKQRQDAREEARKRAQERREESLERAEERQKSRKSKANSPGPAALRPLPRRRSSRAAFITQRRGRLVLRTSP